MDPILTTENIVIIKDHYLITSLLFTILYQLSFFIVAYNNKFDKVTDFAGGSNFIILAILTYFLNENQTVRSTLATIAVVLWGLRLSGFLLYRILVTSEDQRFDEIRNNFSKFLGFFIFQMIWVYIVSLPLIVTNSEANYTPDPKLFSLITDSLGLIMFTVGFIIESVSDIEKFTFRQSNPKPLEILRSGLWNYSRHPNYFGEILLWFGIYFFTYPITSSFKYIPVILSPLFTSILLLLISGIPLSEPKNEKKFLQLEHHDLYLNYINSTSPLIPLPKSLYKNLPNWFKCIALFEWPIYRYKVKEN